MSDQILNISMQRYNTWLESGKLNEEEKKESGITMEFLEEFGF